jgi:hypothetical protein
MASSATNAPPATTRPVLLGDAGPGVDTGASVGKIVSGEAVATTGTVGVCDNEGVGDALPLGRGLGDLVAVAGGAVGWTVGAVGVGVAWGAGEGERVGVAFSTTTVPCIEP